MKCIACDIEITKDMIGGFMFGDRLKAYPVCNDCMNKMMTETTRKAQDRAELPDDTVLDPDLEYDPGLIEEGL